MFDSKTKTDSIILDMVQLAAAFLTLSANPQFLAFLLVSIIVFCLVRKYKIFECNVVDKPKVKSYGIPRRQNTQRSVLKRPKG